MNSVQLKISGLLKTTLFLGNFVLMLFFISFKTNAAIINVSSVSALQTASNTASPGDIIVLANNTYLNSTINISTSDITVRAATPGGVFLNGTNSITISGNNVTFSGFQFTSGSISGNVISVTGNYALLNQLNFNGYSAQKYINISGQYDEVSYCNFENKPTSAPIGNLVHIAPNGTVPNYAKIRYCSFQNMGGAGGDNGNECIRIANGAQSTFLCRTIVEYCYFENTGDGDSEAISVKSRENTLRFNTFRNNQNAMMVFRNGDDNVAYGNFFIGAGGIRVKEANNIYCYNNYFENAGVGGTMNAVSYIFVSPNLKNINFVHNTFVECGLIDLATGATNNTWANNIFKKTSGNIFSGSSAGITWSGNIYQGNLGITIPSGMTNADPLLTLNSQNYYGLSSLSPAINNSSSTYPAIMDIANIDDDPSLSFDISGQSRPALKSDKDAGCDEFTTGNTINHPLVLTEVGPSYLGGPGGIVKQNQTITFPTLPSKILGDADFAPGATSSSGLAVSYTSSNLSVATIVNGNIRIVGAGSSIITAKQPGDATFNAASDVTQTIVITGTQTSVDFRSRASGLWSDFNTWSVYNGTSWVPATSGQLPTSTSKVEISNGNRVDFDLASVTISSLTIMSGGSDSDLDILNTNSLTVTGGITIEAGSGNNDDKFLFVNAGIVSCASLSLASTNDDSRDVQVLISTGSLNVSGDVTMSGTSARNEISFSGNGLLNLGGSISGGTLNTNTSGNWGTVNYNGTSAQTINLAYVYNNLKINNTNSSGASISAAITAANVTGTITVGDVNTGSLFRTAGNTITRGNSNTILVSSGSTMNAGATNITFGTSGTMTINGTFSLTDTDGFTGGTGGSATTINSSNSPTVTLGLDATIDYAGANQTISNRTYRNLKLSGSGLKTFAGASTIAGDMFVETGVRVNPFAGTVHNARSLALGGTGVAIGRYGGNQSTASLVTKNTTFFGSNPTTSSTGAIETSALSPLPVTLTSFTAKPTSTNTVALNWATSSEIVNKGFRIERQAGGVNGKFESLGFVASKANGGNSQTSLYYNFIDASPRSAATAYYRLAQEDLDGKTTFSEVRVVKFSGETVSMVYPNPSNGAVNISRTATGKKMNVQVIDMAGRMVQQFTNITDSNFKLNISKSGMYNIKMTYPETGEQSVQRIVIER